MRTSEHLIHSKSNKEKLSEFHGQFSTYKKDLTLLISHQTLLVSVSSATSLSNIEGKISTMYTFFASLNDDKEEQAMEFVERNGGEEAVKNVVFFNFSHAHSMIFQVGLNSLVEPCTMEDKAYFDLT